MRRRRRARAPRESLAATQWISIVYWWRSSSGSTKTNGSSSSADELGERPVVGVDAGVARGDVRAGVGVASPRRGVDGDRSERARRAGRARHSGRGRASVSRMLAWSRKSRSSPFTLKISALVLAASGPRMPEWNME